jgi:thiamine-monophosphate kinase
MRPQSLLTPALNGGEDYEILFTVPLDLHERIKLIKSVTVIGHMTAAGTSCSVVGDDGSEVAITSPGWK